MDNNSVDLRRKNANLTDAIAEVERARQEQFAAAGRAASANRKVRDVEKENAKLKETIEAQNAALADKNTVILDWMHGSEAFKRLAKKYASDLALARRTYDTDLDKIILEIIEESPQFADTKMAKSVKVNN